MASANSQALNTLRVGVIVLALGTAAIHLYLGLSGLPLFVLNGLGYLALVTALYLPVPQLTRYRSAVRWVLVGYTALTIVLWILVGARTPLGYADKLIEVALITLLLIESRRTR
ncbi:MAG: hypothetical protein ACRDTR_21545 [Rubrobacter sp.]